MDNFWIMGAMLGRMWWPNSAIVPRTVDGSMKFSAGSPTLYFDVAIIFNGRGLLYVSILRARWVIAQECNVHSNEFNPKMQRRSNSVGCEWNK